MKLYQMEPSGNCHKVRLLLSMIQLPYQGIEVKDGEHKRQPLIDWNPLGEVPILEDGEVHLRDSQGILVYLASKYGPQQWWPSSPEALGEITGWLAFAANEIANGPAAIRLVHKFGVKLDEDASRALTEKVFAIVEAQLGRKDWLVGDAPSLADLACYPYLALAPEGKFDLSPYANIRRWFARIEALPGFVSTPGIHLELVSNR